MPPGGLYYVTADHRVIRGDNLRNLEMLVNNYYLANGIQSPDDLRQIIEDQICARLPKELCWQQAGDVIATLIAKGANLVDKIAGTNLEEKAKGCSGCAKRRRKLNKLTTQ